nr:MAG TPA: hypothetical protein [Caudoviricetes sp.]
MLFGCFSKCATLRWFNANIFTGIIIVYNQI